jgi:ADP-ribose pyrophosphatase YjhB (NUDIX family)
MTEIKWKQPAVPRHVIQMLVVDRQSRVLLIHRSEKCKSAKNVWSIPTGTHEIGEYAIDCAAREIQEEFNLEPKLIYLATQYENIAGDANAEEQYHWILSVYVLVVDSLDLLVNKEPELHDLIEIVDIKVMANPLFVSRYNFHSSLQELFTEQGEYLVDCCTHGIGELNANIF